MTTIAANHDCMAADSRVSDESGYYPTDKIFLIRGCIVGVAGNVNDTNTFIDWFKGGCKKDKALPMENKDGTEFEGLVLSKQGLFIFYGCMSPDKVNRPWMAIGSGSQAASVMLRRGHTPLEAVTEAAEHDKSTGAPFKLLSLSDTKGNKRR